MADILELPEDLDGPSDPTLLGLVSHDSSPQLSGMVAPSSRLFRPDGRYSTPLTPPWYPSPPPPLPFSPPPPNPSHPPQKTPLLSRATPLAPVSSIPVASLSFLFGDALAPLVANVVSPCHPLLSSL